MRTVGKLREAEDQLIKELKETTVPSQQLAKKYGVTEQAKVLEYGGADCGLAKMEQPGRPYRRNSLDRIVIIYSEIVTTTPIPLCARHHRSDTSRKNSSKF